VSLQFLGFRHGVVDGLGARGLPGPTPNSTNPANAQTIADRFMAGCSDGYGVPCAKLWVSPPV